MTNFWKITFFAVLTLTSVSAEAKDEHYRYLVRFQDTLSIQTAESTLSKEGLAIKRYIPELDLYIAEPGNLVSFLRDGGFKRLKESPEVKYIEPNIELKAIAVPNDPMHINQKQMKRMRVNQAWDTTTGSTNVVVAVSDTGIDLDHEDLANQIWRNPGEIPGNGTDDDGNGFIDDIHGWDFANKDSDPNDDNMHGTHVAGIIGAEANNGKGIAGVSWKVKLMAVKFLDAGGSGSLEGGIDTILYATKQGADVINASWGSTQSSQALSDAIQFANDKGTLFIAAAGNSSADADRTPHFPSGHPLNGIISVASSQADGVLSSFSNFGRLSVDLAAPGQKVLAPIHTGGYRELSGTSMATPMVAGVAALILSVKPGLSHMELKNALLNATVPHSAYKEKLATGGELDANEAVKQLSMGFQLWPKNMTLNKGDIYPFTAFDPSGAVTWTSSDPAVATVDTNGVVTAVAPGSVTLTAADGSGSVSTESLTVLNKTGGGGGIPGCVPARSKGSHEDLANVSFNFALPFMLAIILFGANRRRRKD